MWCACVCVRLRVRVLCLWWRRVVRSYEDQLTFFDAEIDKLRRKRREYEAKLDAAKQIAAVCAPDGGERAANIPTVPWTLLQNLSL